MSSKHDAAVVAGCKVMFGEQWGFVDVETFRAAIAAFLREWKPDDPISTRAEREQAKRLALHTADELEQP